MLKFEKSLYTLFFKRIGMEKRGMTSGLIVLIIAILLFILLLFIWSNVLGKAIKV